MTGQLAKNAERVRGLAAAGLTRRQAAEETGLTYNYVAMLASKNGIAFPRQPYSGAQRRPDARSKQMAALYKSGKTLEEIGSQFSLTGERVRQIITKYHGLRADGGGQRVRAIAKRQKLEAKRNAHSLMKWGCNWDQYVKIRDLKKPTSAFSTQRKNADRRGIGWELTLWEWWSIWQQSGHWRQRGRGQGYVMCRKGDTGPYSVDNVFIATARENCSDRPQKKSGLPIGVSKNKHCAGYRAHRCINGVHHHLGSFPTPELAHAAYLACEESQQRAAA